MCGIYCSVNIGSHFYCHRDTQELLRARGPDSVKELSISLRRSESQPLESEPLNINVFSTVFALRGDHVESQPLQDTSTAPESFFCWNGEAWKHSDQIIDGNDSQYVFNLLLWACKSPLPLACNMSLTHLQA